MLRISKTRLEPLCRLIGQDSVENLVRNTSSNHCLECYVWDMGLMLGKLAPPSLNFCHFRGGEGSSLTWANSHLLHSFGQDNLYIP